MLKIVYAGNAAKSIEITTLKENNKKNIQSVETLNFFCSFFKYENKI